MSRTAAVRFLARHFVNLCWIDETPGTRAKENDGEGKPFTSSGFVISVEGSWFLITAGHVLKGIEEARQGGQRLTNFAINDSWSLRAKYPNMPFDFDGAWKFHADDPDRGLDYGAIHLRENVRALLIANGVEPILENGWKKTPDQVEELYLLGTPNPPQSNIDTIGGLHVRRSVVFFRVLPLKRRPKGQRAPWIYYRIANPLREYTTEELLKDIDGMSGGPLVGVAPDESGKRRYFCVGIQSGWLENSRIAFACPLRPFGKWLAGGVKQAARAEKREAS